MVAFLYILRAAHPIRGNLWKIGITNRSPAERLVEIRAEGRRLNDATQHAKLYQFYRMHNAADWERKLHYYYRAQNYTKFKGSGKTEWFSIRYPFYALFVLRGRWLLEWLMWLLVWILTAFIFCYV